MNLQTLSTVVGLLASFFMPKAIAYVATSKKHWLNFVIAYGSSALLGAVAALAGGQFTKDVWMDASLFIAASQAAYNVYFKPHAELVKAIVDSSDPAAGPASV